MGFLRSGCRVQALCPKHHPLHLVSGIGRIHRYHGVDSLGSLRRALRESAVDLVIPCDDGAVAQLHVLHGLEPELRALIERSLGSPQGYPIVDSRHELLRTAAELRIRVPEEARVATPEDLVAWHRQHDGPAVVKVDGSCGGFGVRVARSLDDLRAARMELSERPTAATAWKRLIVDRDPLSVWLHRSAKQPDITVQRFIAGRPANLMAACWRGRVLATASVAVVESAGPTGAASVVRPINSPDMTEAADRLAERLQLSGFFGLDFMLQADTGLPYLIEMNPRCTQLGHLTLSENGSLAEVMTSALREQPIGESHTPIRAQTIAFFPQVPAPPCPSPPGASDEAYHDVPWDEPALLRELQARPWPERQWAARLYHALKPLDRSLHVSHD